MSGKKRKELNIDTDAWVVYQLLQSLDYEVYLAIAEFIDNSLQSFLDNRDKLEKMGHKQVQVIIERGKEGTDDYISIKDNAGGISEDRFDRAFRLAEPFDGSTSLHEYGVGMKAAALWFGGCFEVETSAIGEDFKTHVIFDLDHIKKEKSSTIKGKNIRISPEKRDRHYTNIKLKKLIRKLPANKSVLMNHIDDIYRCYLKTSELILIYNKQRHKPKSVKTLKEPYWSNNKGPLVGSPAFEWKKDFSFDMPEPISYVKGTVYANNKWSTSTSGIVIFRRNRAIHGTGKDETEVVRYRPSEVYGTNKNNWYHGRMIIEAHVSEETKVSKSKRIDWTDLNGNSLEKEFLEKLDKAIRGEPKKFTQGVKDNLSKNELIEFLPVKGMIQNFRSETKTRNLSKKTKEKQAQTSTDSTVKALGKHGESDVEDILNISEDHKTKKDLAASKTKLYEETVTLKFGSVSWVVTVRVENNDSPDWYEYAENLKKKSISVSVNINHQFTKNYLDQSGRVFQALVRIAAGMALSEVLCKISNTNTSEQMRVNLNKLLHGSLSKKN